MRKFDDSAQLLLLAAFAIGFTLVISTIMLNNIIYASNMASESTSDLGNYEISNIAQMTDEATRAAYQNASNNYNASPNETIFTQYMDSYATELSSLYAFRGYSVSFENSSLDEAYFTENGLQGGNSEWIVIRNVNLTNIFEIELTDTSKLGNASNPYEVHAINQSGTHIWSMKIYNDTTQVNITVDNTTNELHDPYMLNVINETLFKTRTENDVYDIKFMNSSTAVGYYTITGELADGSSFDLKRRNVINATIAIASTSNKLNVSIPVTIP